MSTTKPAAKTAPTKSAAPAKNVAPAKKPVREKTKHGIYIDKIAVGASFNYKLPVGTEGRIKVSNVETVGGKPRWVSGFDKARAKEIKVSPGSLRP